MMKAVRPIRKPSTAYPVHSLNYSPLGLNSRDYQTFDWYSSIASEHFFMNILSILGKAVFGPLSTGIGMSFFFSELAFDGSFSPEFSVIGDKEILLPESDSGLKEIFLS